MMTCCLALRSSDYRPERECHSSEVAPERDGPDANSARLETAPLHHRPRPAQKARKHPANHSKDRTNSCRTPEQRRLRSTGRRCEGLIAKQKIQAGFLPPAVKCTSMEGWLNSPAIDATLQFGHAIVAP